jgi:hypothetical protein
MKSVISGIRYLERMLSKFLKSVLVVLLMKINKEQQL